MPAPETITGDGDSSRRLVSLFRRLRGSGASLARAVLRPASSGRTADHTPMPGGLPDVPGYELVEEIGRGGMGVVYRAVSLGTGRTVALKVVYPVGAAAALARARFEREVKALARIEHPNIVPVYHAGEGPGFPFFTMKYVPGGTLAHHLGRVRADLSGAVRLVAKVARAVERLHAEGVWHRDLKPLNILLADGDEPLVADFGLAKFRGDDTSPEATQTGAVIGTRYYMSPEQTRGATKAYGPSCDIWALGVILYEVLTGRRPFASADYVELYRQIREDEPAPCVSTNPDAPAELEKVAQTCMAKDPEGRYPSAGSVADALEAWLAGNPIPPVPKRRGRGWWRWAGVVAVAGVVVLAALVVAFGRSPGQPPSDAPSVADRLAAGETVELIGPTGMPSEPYYVLPGSSGVPGLRPDGLCGVQSVGVLGVGLFAEEVGRPVRIEAEVALVLSRDRNSLAGVFAGGRGPEVGAPRNQVVVLARSERREPGRGPDRVHVEAARLALVGWNAVDGQGFDLFDLDERDLFAPPPGPGELRWHAVSVTVRPDRFAGWEPAGPLMFPRAHPGVQQTLPDPGPAVGLFVFHADAAFRNVRLVPD